MKRYSLTILEDDYDKLRGLLSTNEDVENAAYLICKLALTDTETRLLVREVVPVEREHSIEASAAHMKIASASFRGAMKKAASQKGAFVFVHTHPDDVPTHSLQDDREEIKLFRTAYNRIRSNGVHASIVFTSKGISAARVWLEDETVVSIEKVTIVGRRFRYWFSSGNEDPVPEFFDRQVRAFGPDIQRLLRRLRVGVVGAGGTGSAVIEQLTRLGVGQLVIADGETFDASNVNRLHGSRVIDQDLPKTKIAQRLIADIGLGTQITLIPRPISYRTALSQFRECDVIFGCTDDNWGRSLLTRLAIYYIIPVFDMGVKIDSEDGVIRSINGRVTTLMPGTACLYCRNRITAERVAAESMRATNPEQAAEQVAQGYIPELADPAPAVVTFTTSIASFAINEFLHKLTGFMGEDRNSSEVLHLIDATTVRRHSKPSLSGCFCGEKEYWGRGDTRPFLDTTWRNE